MQVKAKIVRFNVYLCSEKRKARGQALVVVVLDRAWVKYVLDSLGVIKPYA